MYAESYVSYKIKKVCVWSVKNSCAKTYYDMLIVWYREKYVLQIRIYREQWALPPEVCIAFLNRVLQLAVPVHRLLTTDGTSRDKSNLNIQLT